VKCACKLTYLALCLVSVVLSPSAMILYDRPPSTFKPATLEMRHRVRVTVSEEIVLFLFACLFLPFGS